MNRAIRFQFGFMALLLASNAYAQDNRVQRQQKAPTVAASPSAVPLAAQSQSTAQDRYQRRAGIVIEMTPSPQRKAVAQPRR